MKITVAAVLLSMMFVGANAQSLKSPDGKFEMNFQLKNGVPFYNLKYNGSTVVEDSKLGLRLFKDTSISFASEITKAEDAKFDLNNDFVKTSEKRDSKTKPGNLFWVKRKIISIIIMNWQLR
ncbi:glycoside hydrolase family 97 N-terminal domain-containing protein [Chryseobacterium indoltheticum]|uniref:glycoside hydrolase family 97 N-terminal domain-containing protein n=1 Tax=Chryseobacterium indoltheticum TaxID=254 RepID=UPI003F4944F4